MAEFIKVAKTSEVEEGKGKVVEANGKQLAIFKQGGEFIAMDNTCLHQGGPLGEGELEGNIVTCPWHQWKYDIKTGENQFDKNMKLATYKTKVEGDDVLVEV